MIATRHFINGFEFRPKNADDIGFKMDLTAGWKEAELSVDSIQLENEARDIVMQHKSTIGMQEGIPYTVKVGNLTYEYYIDLMDNARFTSSMVEVNIKRRKSVDWFKPLADGLSFEALNKSSTITGAIDCPYVIVKDNQGELLIMLIITTYTLTKELISSVRELAQAASLLTEAATPDIPPAAKIGDYIGLAVRVAAQIIYVILLIAALINMISQIVELIIPKVRYFKGNTFRSLITQGCAHPAINIGFSSSLLEMDTTIVPKPLQKTNKSIFKYLATSLNQAYNKGYPTSDDAFPDLGSMIDFVCDWLNAEWRIINNTLFIEQKEFFESQSGLNITTTLELQSERESAWTYNTSEVKKRMYFHYAYDPMDTHTYNEILGISAEYNTEPITVVNPDLVSIKGLDETALNVSLASRKKDLTYVETELLKFCKLADGIINTFGGSSSLSAKVLNRIGVMQISQQFFSNTKIIWSIGGKQPANYLDYIGMNAIYQRRHTTNQAKENFQEIHEADVKFSPQMFEQFVLNNYVSDQLGNDLKIITFEWINESRMAHLIYTKLSPDDINTKTTLING